MLITSIRTRAVTQKDSDLFAFLDEYLKDFENGSILAITSKIISIMQGRIVRVDSVEKDELIEQESEFFLPRSINPYNVSFAIKHNILAPSAGIDESNGNGFYVLWPEKLQETTNAVREYLVKRFSIEHAGVIITDSKTTPMRWGVTGIALSHSGFQAVNDYIGKKDIFGRPFEYEKVNMMDSLAAAAVLTMGEGAELMPLAVISDIPYVHFQDRNPTEEEMKDLTITKEIDLYEPLLTSVPWKKGRAK